MLRFINVNIFMGLLRTKRIGLLKDNAAENVIPEPFIVKTDKQGEYDK